MDQKLCKNNCLIRLGSGDVFPIVLVSASLSWKTWQDRDCLVVPDLSGADFAYVVLDDIAPVLTILSPIELEINGVMIRLHTDTYVCRLAKLVLALKVGR